MIPPLARRFVAGETSAEAIDHAVGLNDRGVGAILNLLGEHYDERGPADADAAAYERLIDDVADVGSRSCVSVKPSQLGLGVGESVFRENLDRVVDRAAERGVFVWLDMEDHTTTDATLDAFEHHATELRDGERRAAPTDGEGSRTSERTTREERTSDVTDGRATPNGRASNGGRRDAGANAGVDAGVGVCVQANLRRTRADLERLADLPGKVRLVKGAYDPPADVAYDDRDRIDEQFREDLRYMFEHFDDGVAVGSHDPEMISLARSLHAEFGTPYEVQMLMGVRTDAQFDLADQCEVWQYVPYGDRWLSYLYRRVSERKANALFALRALVGG